MEEKPFSNISYEQFLNEERLMGSRCKNCGTSFVPPRSICVECYGSEMEWVETKGDGKLISFTCIAVGTPFMIKEGYDRKNPYCTGIVELENGVRVVARVDGVSAIRPESIKIGTPLTVEFLHHSEGANLKTFLAFKPVESG